VEAFRMARVLGADWVELDARRTADGAIVVHHDAQLPDGRLIMATARVDLPPTMCDLAAALDACVGMKVNIEIKNWPDDADFDPGESVARAVVALVGERQVRDSVLISCFHRPTIDLVHLLDPGIPTAQLGYGPVGTWDDFAADLAASGHRTVHPWYPMVDAEAVRAIHAAGLEVNVWTVNDPEHMAQLVAIGVDGLCSDTPDVVRRVVDAAVSAGGRSALEVDG
ncbi:MAG: glycerophosphodiester phosphodiesterase, partial [Aquihabitans sp.]